MKKIESIGGGNLLWFILTVIITIILSMIKFTEITDLILPSSTMNDNFFISTMPNIIVAAIASLIITAFICAVIPNKKN
jgi:ABC-type antimicrobial peptide transport system permease subunit